MRYLVILVLVLLKNSTALPAPATSTNFLTTLMGSFRGNNAINVTQFLSTFQMPICLKQCMPQMDGVLRILHNNTNQPEVVSNLCRQLQSSATCATAAGCSTLFMDAATQAFQFVCVENMESFGASLECMKEASDDLQPECEAHCGVQAKMLDDASSNRLDQLFDVDNVCNSTMCLLHCFKDRINSKCMGQTNVIESLMGSVLRGEGHGFEKVLSWIVPEGCRNKAIITLPKELPIGGSPMSVGGTVGKPAVLESPRSMGGPSPPVQQSGNSVETALLIDGEIRTLQCSMLDWNRKPVETPDFESLAKIMTAQLLPFSYPKDKPRSVGPVSIPSENDVVAAETRVEEKERASADEAEVEVDAESSLSSNDTTSDAPVWLGDRSDLVIPENSSALSAGMIVLVLSAGYWLWQAMDDISF